VPSQSHEKKPDKLLRSVPHAGAQGKGRASDGISEVNPRLLESACTQDGDRFISIKVLSSNGRERNLNFFCAPCSVAQGLWEKLLAVVPRTRIGETVVAAQFGEACTVSGQTIGP
jgi:hypothetical protein